MSGAADAAERTALEERLIDLIRRNGPISVADYMSDALFHPNEGYYMTGAPIGAEGDFTTAPEISQIFGELVGLWLVQSFIDMGEPKRFNLVEMGPGRGVLMADILRAAALRPAFLAAAEIWLVETSGRLRHEQQRRLRDQPHQPRWTDAFSTIPPAPTLLVANELFDCLPIRQFERTSAGWRERLVGLSQDGASLAFQRAPTPPLPGADLPPEDAAPLGAVVERSETAETLAAEIAQAIVANGGRALVIDYGHYGEGFGDTLQAVRRHRYWPVLASPGKADVTAHVNFERLARVAIDHQASVWGPAPQGAFLSRLGLDARLARLCAGKTPEEAEALRRGAHRIAAPEEMGEVFKAMCIAAPGLPPPQGFCAP